MSNPRVVVWFSCGAASAVASKLTLRKYGHERVVLAYIDTGSEHQDSERFLKDCERWFNAPIERLKSEKYQDTWDVFRKERYLSGVHGAKCTGVLKRAPRLAFQRPTDIQVFGYTSEECDRADRFREQNFEVRLETPLIENGLSKSDCLAMIDRAGIELPAMYRLGYENNNCIGCVKGGMGYWNKIRRDFPEVFARMAAVERELDATILRDAGQQLFLDELDPKRGKFSDEPKFECSLLCHMAEQAI